MGPHDDADDLPTGPPPREERPWLHPSELPPPPAGPEATAVRAYAAGPSRPRLWIVLTASALVGTVVAVVVVGLVHQLGPTDNDGDAAAPPMSAAGTLATASSVVYDERPVSSSAPRAAIDRRAWLGIEGADADGGVLVTGVADSGPAATAGVHTGDLIVAAARETVASMDDLQAILARFDPGAVFVVEVLRDAHLRIRLMAVLGARA
jgi:membrane-associated protease RseP (regulator of RpoE activity)